MATRHKRREPKKVTLGKVASQARESRIRSSIVPKPTGTRKQTVFTRRGEELQARNPDLSRIPLTPSNLSKFKPDLRRDVAGRALGALSDMRDKGISFTEAASRWHLNRRTFRKYARSGLHTLPSTGRVRSKKTDRVHYLFFKPTTKPGKYDPVETKSLKERQTYVQWRVALDAAKGGDSEKMEEFIAEYGHSPLIGGVRLPTSVHEIQKISDALAEEGTKFEGPYRVSGSPS